MLYNAETGEQLRTPDWIPQDARLAASKPSSW
jgi:hypothetical protein